jgi:nucleoside-diphosphate-sugar epimerase
MNILITGGLGFVGFNLYKFLKNKKYNVYCLDKNKKNLKKLKLQKQKKIILGNFLNFKLVKKNYKREKNRCNYPYWSNNSSPRWH